MDIALWIGQGLLALMFLAAGSIKLTKPQAELTDMVGGWVDDFSAGTVKLIGVLEIAGALGLILPAITGVAPVLVPWAAVGLAVMMALAAIVHVRRGEASEIAKNLIPMAIAIFVAWGRFGGWAF